MSGNDFSDVEELLARNQGMLAGEAFGELERIKEKPNPQDRTIDFTCTCLHCSQPMMVKIPVYEEMVPAMLGVAPRDAHTGIPWGVHQGVMYPPIRCGACQQAVAIPVTPDKAARFVNSMVSVGALTRPQVDHRIAEVNRLAGRR
jgi:hypothetical protein